MIKTYVLGDELQLSALFSNKQTNLPADPTTVVLKLLDPNGSVFLPSNTKTAVGVYISSFTPTTPGYWHARWEGSGAVVAAMESTFEVQPSAFT